MPRLRLGVALLVPAPFDREVDALRRAVGDGSLGRIPAHLTLVPPVNVRDDRLADAMDVLRDAAASTRPFALALGPPATFHPDTPVLYLPATDPTPTSTRQPATGPAVQPATGPAVQPATGPAVQPATGPAVQPATGPAGRPPTGQPGPVFRLRDLVFRPPLARRLTWPFVPHVTLAEELAPDRLVAAVAVLSSYRLTVTFDRVHLLQEGPGRIWTPMADAEFSAPAVIGRGGLPLELSHSEGPDPETVAFADREWPLYDREEFGPRVSWSKEPFTIAARREGIVVGFARGWTAGGVAFLSELIVAGNARGQGIGSHLLAEVTSLAGRRGCHRMALRALAASGAQGFYAARGWVQEARFSPWIHDRDMVQLRRDL
ncbi:MAG: GNAT family N-acetyltransferase [Acidimicrobiales bacterium]